ncbi:MAG TPA: CARDB domain-containing protein [Gemmatimonadales bacterium]|nr:CARDB domain-containing protein [Gemmatimonadales bacterium]
MNSAMRFDTRSCSSTRRFLARCSWRRSLVPVILLGSCVAGSDGPQGPLRPADPEPGLRADLFAGPIEVPDHIRVDSILEMTIGVQNGGTGVAETGWVVRVFLSVDRVIDSADIQIDQFAASRPLLAGTGDQYLRHKKLRGSTPLGSYYVGSILDVTGAVTETSETNNTLRSPAQIILTPKVSTPPGID